MRYKDMGCVEYNLNRMTTIHECTNLLLANKSNQTNMEINKLLGSRLLDPSPSTISGTSSFLHGVSFKQDEYNTQTRYKDMGGAEYNSNQMTTIHE